MSCRVRRNRNQHFTHEDLTDDKEGTVCCGNYYLCKIDRQCKDKEECHAIHQALLMGERPCKVVVDEGGFHYEFETVPNFKPCKNWKRRTTK